jgi:hypothetical protein
VKFGKSNFLFDNRLVINCKKYASRVFILVGYGWDIELTGSRRREKDFIKKILDN